MLRVRLASIEGRPGAVTMTCYVLGVGMRAPSRFEVRMPARVVTQLGKPCKLAMRIPVQCLDIYTVFATNNLTAFRL